jgi:iron complex transport system substrate-binding protein
MGRAADFSVRWASELIAIAGGEDVFPSGRSMHAARDRIIADPADVVARQPDIVIGSWCGKHFRPEQRRRARRLGRGARGARRLLHEIKSAVILTPGPVAIEEGLPALRKIFEAWAAAN